MLGLSTATLGWSRCLQRTQSLFFSFLFFPTKSFNRVWRRKENLKAIIFCWLFDAPLLQCCARDGDRAGVFVSPSLTSFWAGRGSAMTAAAREHRAHGLFRAFPIPDRRAEATWTDAGRAASPGDL